MRLWWGPDSVARFDRSRGGGMGAEGDGGDAWVKGELIVVVFGGHGENNKPKKWLQPWKEHHMVGWRGGWEGAYLHLLGSPSVLLIVPHSLLFSSSSFSHGCGVVLSLIPCSPFVPPVVIMPSYFMHLLIIHCPLYIVLWCWCCFILVVCPHTHTLTTLQAAAVGWWVTRHPVVSSWHHHWQVGTLNYFC